MTATAAAVIAVAVMWAVAAVIEVCIQGLARAYIYTQRRKQNAAIRNLVFIDV